MFVVVFTHSPPNPTHNRPPCSPTRNPLHYTHHPSVPKVPSPPCNDLDFFCRTDWRYHVFPSVPTLCKLPPPTQTSPDALIPHGGGEGIRRLDSIFFNISIVQSVVHFVSILFFGVSHKSPKQSEGSLLVTEVSKQEVYEPCLEEPFLRDSREYYRCSFARVPWKSIPFYPSSRMIFFVCWGETLECSLWVSTSKTASVLRYLYFFAYGPPLLFGSISKCFFSSSVNLHGNDPYVFPVSERSMWVV